MLPLKENCQSELNTKLHVFFFIYTKIKAKNTNQANKHKICVSSQKKRS